MKKEHAYRGAIYLVGLLLLALGITLNTKVSLGVSPIISVSYAVSVITNRNFGNVTLVQYCIFVLVEMILHLVMKREKRQLLLDALQIVLSLVFTRFMNLFSAYIPVFAEVYPGAFWGGLGGRLLLLVLAITLTGVGAALSLNMRLIPNPGDGIVQTISDFIHKSVGLTKNGFDLFNVCLTTAVSLLFAGRVVGIGVGTLLAVLGVGRVIAVWNHFTKEKLLTLAGLPSA